MKGAMRLPLFNVSKVNQIEALPEEQREERAQQLVKENSKI